MGSNTWPRPGSAANLYNVPSFPVPKDGWSNWAKAANLRALPSTLNDGSYFVPGASSIALVSSAGSNVWSVAPTAINASAASIGPLWVDTTDNAVWVVAFNSGGTTAYLAKIALSTGTVTTIGSFTVSASNTYRNLYRAAMGSGDFTLLGTNSLQHVAVSVSSSTGATTVAEANFKSGGVGVASFSALGVSASVTALYRSLDGTLTACMLVTQPTVYLMETTLIIYRGTKMAAVPVSGPAAGDSGNMTVVVGNYIYPDAAISGLIPYGMLRSDFDAWLSAVANVYAI